MADARRAAKDPIGTGPELASQPASTALPGLWPPEKVLLWRSAL